MQKLPKFPKGLKARIAKQERFAKRKKEVSSRRSEIEKAKKRLDTLRNSNRR